MKYIFNKILTCLLVPVVLMAISSCSHKDPTKDSNLAKEDGQKVAEAYANGDWGTIVSICDTLMDDDDTMNCIEESRASREEQLDYLSDTWDAMTDGMYGDMPDGFDGDYDFLGF